MADYVSPDGIGEASIGGRVITGEVSAIEISNAAELKAIENDMAGDYVLVNDIDLGNFEPVGYASGTGYTAFSGTLDGQGYQLYNGNIDYSSDNYVGVFSYNTGELKNIGVTNTDVSADRQSGLLVGENHGLVAQCYSTGSVTAVSYSGGLVGVNLATITNSYSRADVSLTGTIGGGLVGGNISGTTENCYSTGYVTADSNEGGLVGYNSGTCIESYWDTQTSGQSTSASGTGKTTAEMTDINTFSPEWDIVSGVNDGYVWGITSSTNDGYPFLQATISPQSGTRISNPLDVSAATDVNTSLIEWTAETDAESSVTISTAITTGAEPAEGDYTEASSGASIPGITRDDDLSGKTLWIRQELESADGQSNPKLTRLYYEITYEEPV